MDFSLMTGYEFEDYIAKVLRQQGFEVEQTAYYQFAEYEEFWPYSVFSEFDGFKNKLIRETKNLHFCASE